MMTAGTIVSASLSRSTATAWREQAMNLGAEQQLFASSSSASIAKSESNAAQETTK
jgi:hypothetical protein